MPRLRDVWALVALVSEAEMAGWDVSKPRTLNRARDRLHHIVTTFYPDVARVVYDGVA